MTAGDLRQRVTLRKRAEVSDGHGGWLDAPIVIAHRVPARVEPLIGRALDRALQIDPRASHRVTLRYRADVASGLELIYHDGRRGDRPFDVVGPPIDVEERHRELVLHCAEAEVAA